MPAPAGTITAKEAEKQLAELKSEAKEAPKSAAPGSHPLKCVEDDAQALAQYQGESAPGAEPATGLWHRTAYGAPVFVKGDRMPAAASKTSSARGEQ